LISNVISILGRCGSRIYCVTGQHDLPSHTPDLIDEAGVTVFLWGLSNFVLLYRRTTTDITESPIMVSFFPWGSQLEKIPVSEVAVCHMMVINEQPLWPGQQSPKAVELLKKYPYDLIVCGDNHQDFIVEYEGRKLLNCGAMMRSKIDEMDRIPKVYLWRARDNFILPVPLPIEKNVWVSEPHVYEVKERNERLEEFGSMLEKGKDFDLSFEDNLERKIEQNDVEETVANMARGWTYE
jgi:hypothetical protein